MGYKPLLLVLLLGAARAWGQSGALTAFDEGNRAFVRGDYVAALPLYTQAISDTAHEEFQDDALYMQGKCYENQQNWKKAEESYREVIARFPEADALHDAYYSLGQYYANAPSVKDYNLAVSFYQQALTAQPQGRRAKDLREGLGEAYLETERWDDAEQVLQGLMKELPEAEVPLRVHYQLAEFYRNPRNPNRSVQKALKEYQSLIKHYPESSDSPKVYFALANCYRDLEQWDKAITHYSKVVETYPSSLYAAVARNVLQVCYEKRQEQLVSQLQDILKKSSAPQAAPSEQMQSIINQLRERTSSSKMTIQSDRSENDPEQGGITYAGNVRIQNGETLVQAERARMAPGGADVHLEGEIKVSRGPSLVMFGEKGLYSAVRNEITLEGHASLLESGKELIRAGKLTYNFETGKYVSQ